VPAVCPAREHPEFFWASAQRLVREEKNKQKWRVREIVVGERGIKGSERGRERDKGIGERGRAFLAKDLAAVPAVRPAREHAEFFWASAQQRLAREKGAERGIKGPERGGERDKGIEEREGERGIKGSERE
jgi:hypothetical protein